MNPISTDDPKSDTDSQEPSVFVRVAMRPMTKVFNPVVRRFAGRRHFNMAGEIHHRGRRTGREYVTPATARLNDGHFWVSLTFGPNSDWCRNVRAAGECTIRWQGRDYLASMPLVVGRHEALAAAGKAFKRREKVMLKAIGVRYFLRLDVVEAL